MFRPADKTALANAIWSLGNCSIQEQISDSVKYVIDGGSLLQRLPWTYGETFGGICKNYVEHVKRKYCSASVVFDGYLNGSSTKDCAHQKRSRGLASTNVQFNK